jgi:hypothetical protein
VNDCINRDSIRSLINMHKILNKHIKFRILYKKYMEVYIKRICLFKLTNANFNGRPVVVAHAPVLPSLFDAIYDLAFKNQLVYENSKKDDFDLASKIDIINDFFKNIVLSNIEKFNEFYPLYGSSGYLSKKEFMLELKNKYIMVHFFKKHKLEIFMALWYPHLPRFKDYDDEWHFFLRCIFDYDKNPDCYVLHGHSEELADLSIDNEVPIKDADLEVLDELECLLERVQFFERKENIKRKENIYYFIFEYDGKMHYYTDNGKPIDVFANIRSRYYRVEIHRAILDLYLKFEFMAYKACSENPDKNAFSCVPDNEKNELLALVRRYKEILKEGEYFPLEESKNSFEFWNNIYSIDGHFGKDEDVACGERKIAVFIPG